MKINKSTGYALVSMCYIAHHYQEGNVLISDISKQFDLSRAYLVNIVQQLMIGNVLRSKRGCRGGYTLARPAEDITILQIVEAVDGPLLNYQ